MRSHKQLLTNAAQAIYQAKYLTKIENRDAISPEEQVQKVILELSNPNFYLSKALVSQ